MAGAAGTDVSLQPRRIAVHERSPSARRRRMASKCSLVLMMLFLRHALAATRRSQPGLERYLTTSKLVSPKM
jgi:hypothetical protein